MVKSNSELCQKYGVPIYGAAWVPTKNLSLSPSDDQQDSNSWLVFCGGGGEGSSGIPNCVSLIQFDSNSNSLSPNLVSKLGTEGKLPYRMAVHPGGEGVICSFPESCRLFEWDVKKSEGPKLTLKSSEKNLSELENVGQQLTLTFSTDGTALAVGGEDGHLRVFKWPSMELLLDQTDENSTVKDLTFSSDGKFLVSLGSRGPGRVWEVSSLKIVATIPKEKDEVFGFCRFSQTKANSQILYVTAMRSQGSIVCWDPTSWKRIRSKQVVRDPISAFNVSADGELLAVGTIQGDIHIMGSDLRTRQVIKKAHLGLVTVLTFSEDSRSLFSVSLDSSARVTLINNKNKQSGLSIWVILFVIYLAVMAYILKNKGVF
ncbi:hypothetical protein ACHQM5_009740 [Ranunculus cassubicifolius]